MLNSSLIKLVKYDLKATSTIGIVQIITVVLGIIARIFAFIPHNNDYTGIADIAEMFTIMSVMTAFIMLFVIYAATFFIIIQNYWNTLIGDQGYLYHTLPVRSSDLILSKLVTALIWQIFNGIIVVLFIIGAATLIPEMDIAKIIKGFSETYKEVLAEISAEEIGGSILMIFFSALIMFIDFFKQYLTVFLAMGIGQLVRKHRMLLSIGCYIGIGIIIRTVQQVILAATYMPVLYNNADSPVSAANILMAAMAIFSLAVCVVIFMITDFIFRKKLNLE